MQPSCRMRIIRIRVSLAQQPAPQSADEGMDSTLPQTQGPMVVAVDHYAVSREDRLLCARLKGSFAVCISDEVFESGALLHMQAGRPGKVAGAELTDSTLSTDLLLLDRCLTELRAAEPQARHWQARFFAHADPAAGGEERLD